MNMKGAPLWRSIVRSALATIVAGWLASCGGGGSSGGGGSVKQPPVATLTAPVDLASGLTGTLNVTATASGNVGIAGVEFQIDGITIGSEDTHGRRRRSASAAAPA